MKNRNKKIILSIIIVLIATIGFVVANQLNGILTSKVTPKDEIVLSNDNNNNTNVSNDIKQDETKVNEENKNHKSDNKEDNSKEKKTSKETSNEKQNDNKQIKEQNNEAKSNQVKNNSNINKSKNTNNEQEKFKSKQNNNTKTTQNEIKKQVVHLSIIDSINNKTLFCGQVPINSNENFNTIMNKFFNDNGVRHINRGGYMSMMYGLSEFSKGPNSGWCYYINGNKASVGILGYIPKNGDRIVWKYLKDGVNK